LSVATTANRIRGVLQRDYESLVDISDWEGRPPEQAQGAFLSRALAALAIKSFAGADPETAGKAVVDGFDDGGLDALYFDAATDSLFIVQSKWSGSGDASFDEAAASKFVNGVKRLLNDDFSAFNSKVRAKEPEIREVLYSDRDVRIRIVTVHTSKQQMAPHVKRILDQLVSELNDPVPIADHIDIAQAGVYELITAESKDPKIKLQAGLNDWGMIEQPFLAYYGRVGLNQVVQWWEEHRNKLFSQNLRLFYQSSSVNDALRRTLSEDPESFWYFNNGITIIADRVVKGLAGAPGHKFAIFTCEGASVVNGAQTVGTVGSSTTDGIQIRETESAWVQVRIISLEKTPPDFARKITRAANLQNAVGNREFAAMDPLQHGLAVEFALDKRRYVYKSGELDPKGSEGCSIVEATQALACAHSVRLAVEAKREIGSLWADTDRAPYTDIFTPELTAERVWRAVSVMRAVDEVVQLMRSSELFRADLIGTHMQRIILHLVFQDPQVIPAYPSNAPLEGLLNVARQAARRAFGKVSAYIEAHHPTDYLANFSKNAEKCEALIRYLDTPRYPTSPKDQADFWKTLGT
jgi:hypothetical protein